MIDVDVAVVRVEAVWNTHTEALFPWPSRVRDDAVISMKLEQYTPGPNVTPARSGLARLFAAGQTAAWACKYAVASSAAHCMAAWELSSVEPVPRT
jgi:hypothetical protein